VEKTGITTVGIGPVIKARLFILDAGIVNSDGSNSDLSKALILHPTLSNYMKEHPNFDPFILTNEDISY
jgi:hypothetical protein